MIRRIFIAAVLALFAVTSWAQLTPAQISTLRTVVLAEPALATARQTGDDQAIANWCNALASPAFTVWKTSVTITATGRAFNGTEWAGMTGTNHTRLQTVAQYMATYNPGLSDIRAMFNDIWSGAGGTNTRAALLVLWKRAASNAEKVLAVAPGTGTDADPKTLGFEGTVTPAEASLLR